MAWSNHLREKIIKNDSPRTANVDNENIFLIIFERSCLISLMDKIKMANELMRNMLMNITTAGKNKIFEYFAVGMSRQNTAKSLASPAPQASVR